MKSVPVDPLPHTHDNRPRRWSRAAWIVTGLATGILLSPLFFFLLSPDQALFHVSGQRILDGAVHYRDIVDLKPPLIYHIYALAILVFGRGEASSHILDFILQAVTCGLLAAIIRRASRDDAWAACAVLTYAIIYVSLSSGTTGVAESYTGLFALPAVWLLMFRRSKLGFVIVGVLCGLLFVLKFTLAIVLVAAILGEFVVHGERWRSAVRSSALMIAGFAGVMLAFAAYVIGLGALPGFLEMNQFLGRYIQLNGPSLREWIGHTTVALPAYLGEGYTLAYFVATVGGVVLSLRARSERGSATTRLLRLCTLALTLLFFSVLVETRYGAGSFSRLLPFGVPLATYAALALARWLMRSRPWDAYTRTVVAIMIGAALLFSPALRYTRHAVGSAVVAIKGEAGYDSYYNRSTEWYTRGELREIGSFIQEHRRPSDVTFVASSVGALVYAVADEVPPFKIYHSAFFTENVAPDAWRDTTSKYLIATAPRFIVINRHDSLASVTGVSTSSEAELRSLNGVDSMMRSSYRVALSTRRFDLYDRVR